MPGSVAFPIAHALSSPVQSLRSRVGAASLLDVLHPRNPSRPLQDLKMIPLAVTVALGLVSFSASMFVLFRLLLPILPPHPLSRRVPPV